MINKSIWKSLFLFFILFGSVLQAQIVTFQRILPGTNRNMITVGCEPTEEGGFYLLNISEDMSTSELDSTINVSKHDPKGNVKWSVDYSLRNINYLNDFRYMDIENIGADTIAISGVYTDFNRTNNSHFLLKVDPSNGDLLYSGSVKNDNEILGPTFFTKVIRDTEDNINYFGTHTNSDSTIWVHLEKVGRQFNRESAKSFAATDSDGELLPTGFWDATILMDSTTAFSVAIVDSTGLRKSGLVVVDSLNNVNWAASYSLQNAFYDGIQIFGMAETADTGFVYTGNYVELLGPSQVSFVFKTDSIGDVEWAYDFNDVELGSISFLNDILVTNKDEILVTGKSVNVFTGDLFDFGIFLDNGGNVIRQVQYNSDNSFFLDLASGLIVLGGDTKNSSDGTMYYGTTGIDLTKGGILTPLVVKSDRDGNAICHDTLVGDFFTNITVLKDTLILAEDDIVTRDTIMVGIDDFDNHDIPVLILLDTVFCPQDPIDVTLGNEFEFASSYIWSTGDTTPMIQAMEEGDFMVTVTFDVGVCFALCDTATITKRDFPEASISASIVGTCEFALFASSTTEVTQAVWSTGDTINPLIISEDGAYSVTITDACSNTAESTINYSPPDLEVEPSINNSRRCEDKVIGLRLFEVNRPLDPDTYMWSTGETDPEIFVSEPGTYTVTVTDVCGYTTEASFNITPDQLDFSINSSISLDYTDNYQNFCLVDLIASINPSLFSIESIVWNTSQTGEQITVSEAGVYSIVVTDICGNTGTSEITVTEDDLNSPSDRLNVSINRNGNCDSLSLQLTIDAFPNVQSIEWSNGVMGIDSIPVLMPGLYTATVTNVCGDTASVSSEVIFDVLRFPNVFFVSNNVDDVAHDENKEFKPYIQCPDLFSGDGYFLEVYNRWGNLVFETEDVGDGWRGNDIQNQNKLFPSGVYIYNSRWTDSNGNEQSANGNVTLVRP